MENKQNHRICQRCVMDTTDPYISFDAHGYCNLCIAALDFRARKLIPAKEKEEKFFSIIRELKENGKGKNYDCVIGVSGGVDSTYLAYLLKNKGIRPLAVHLDNGWNAELAVSNIKKVLNALDIELHTTVLDWEEFKDLQLSFLKASTPDSEIPTDHAIVSLLKQMAVTEDVPLILGTNHNSESIMPKMWSQGHGDWLYIKNVQKKLGTHTLKTFPHTSIWKHLWHDNFKGIKFISLLNYIDYDKDKEKKFLIKELGWVDYGGKHYESLYTKFYQSYILPKKFGYDKRKAHFSSLIIANLMTREEAFEALKQSPWDETTIHSDKQFFIKKLGMDEHAFNDIINSTQKAYEDYSPTWNRWLLKNHRRIFKYITHPVDTLKKIATITQRNSQ